MGFTDVLKNTFGLSKSEEDASESNIPFRSTQAGQEWVKLAEFLGIDPDLKDSMQEATYYSCIRILRETVGKMPLRLMQSLEDGGIKNAVDHPLYRTLALRPNRFTTATAFWSSLEQDRQHNGNAYVYKAGAGTARRPLELWRMPPDEVEVWYDDACRFDKIPDIYYIWSNGGEQTVLKSCEVLHFKSSDTIDGVMGIPMIDRLNGLVNGAIGAQDFQNRLITSGMTAKAVLQYTSNLDDAAARTFSANIERYAKGELRKQGLENIIPIPVGASLTPLNLKLTDAQFMELKKYSAVQIAAAMGIKPQQIGDQTKQSYASSQAQQEMFYTDTMLYILRHYEDEVSYKVLTPEMYKQGYFVEFDSEVMLRSDFKTLVESNKVAIESGQMRPNEARKKLKLPADPDGDVLLGNGNLIPIGMAGQQYINNDTSEGGEQDGNQVDDQSRQSQEPDSEPDGDESDQ